MNWRQYINDAPVSIITWINGQLIRETDQLTEYKNNKLVGKKSSYQTSVIVQIGNQLIVSPFSEKSDQFTSVLSKIKIESVIDFQNSTQINLKNISNKDHATEITNQLLKNDASVGIGGYLEERNVYQAQHYETTSEARSIHLGIDLWCNAKTSVFSPLDARIHSFQDNIGFCNYGPTIILEHKIQHLNFYTLYGHLSRESLTSLFVGKEIKGGDKIAELGEHYENGDWLPHLHFQIILNLLQKEGDFDGVCRKSELELFAQLCPSPQLLLRSK